MPRADLAAMDVDALLTLRADIEKTLAARGRELERQLGLLGGETRTRRGRPPGLPGRPSVLKGKKVTPKYRGPNGETWAGRGATPRWLRALIDEGHSIEEFGIAKGGKRSATGTKVVKKRKTTAKKKEAVEAA